jgi:hypothetical protein
MYATVTYVICFSDFVVQVFLATSINKFTISKGITINLFGYPVGESLNWFSKDVICYHYSMNHLHSCQLLHGMFRYVICVCACVLLFMACTY